LSHISVIFKRSAGKRTYNVADSHAVLQQLILGIKQGNLRRITAVREAVFGLKAAVQTLRGVHGSEDLAEDLKQAISDCISLVDGYQRPELIEYDRRELNRAVTKLEDLIE
jgi:hypothetical protein